jgi:hypothetical protein
VVWRSAGGAYILRTLDVSPNWIARARKGVFPKATTDSVTRMTDDHQNFVARLARLVRSPNTKVSLLTESARCSPRHVSGSSSEV